ncbi:unnamed protein product [Adineta steineri]|uniref:F-box domain-containing protein n=1 Tax=Adineta steineri TaxID=433720 RepID=A0A814R881_9BILA|nr:unnamed protein product [Adineta steineri]
MTSNYVPTRFLSLSNELIYHVFEYLSSNDLVVSFGHLPNNRLLQLFHSYIALLDFNFTDLESLTWLNQNRAVIKQYVRRVVTDIELVEKVLQVLPKLDALTINYDQDTQLALNQFVAQCQTTADVNIGKLILWTYDGDLNTNTTNLLLDGNYQLPEHTLNVSGCRLALDMSNLPLYSRLRHLNCIVEEEAFLHALLACLPNLETIKVGLISSGLERESDIFSNAVVVGVSTETDADGDVEDRVVFPRYRPKKDNPTTPPNAMIFVSGNMKTKDLIKAGIGAKIIGILVIFFASIVLLSPIFHIHALTTNLSNSTLIGNITSG